MTVSQVSILTFLQPFACHSRCAWPKATLIVVRVGQAACKCAANAQCDCCLVDHPARHACG